MLHGLIGGTAVIILLVGMYIVKGKEVVQHWRPIHLKQLTVLINLVLLQEEQQNLWKSLQRIFQSSVGTSSTMPGIFLMVFIVNPMLVGFAPVFMIIYDGVSDIGII